VPIADITDEVLRDGGVVGLEFCRSEPLAKSKNGSAESSSQLAG
jgi:hypothetical protein